MHVSRPTFVPNALVVNPKKVAANTVVWDVKPSSSKSECWNYPMVGFLIVIAILVLILLVRYTGLGRDWWPRDPFSN